MGVSLLRSDAGTSTEDWEENGREKMRTGLKSEVILWCPSPSTWGGALQRQDKVERGCGQGKAGEETGPSFLGLDVEESVGRGFSLQMAGDRRWKHPGHGVARWTH